MNFCFHCASQLVSLKTACGYISRYRCSSCDQRYQLTWGNGKHSSDCFQFMGNRKFDIEEPKGDKPLDFGESKVSESGLDFGF